MDLRPQSKGYSMEDLIQIQCRYLGGGNETGWGEEWELVWNWSRDLFLLESKTTLPPPPLIQLSYSVLTETRRFPCTVKSVSNFHSCVTFIPQARFPASSLSLSSSLPEERFPLRICGGEIKTIHSFVVSALRFPEGFLPPSVRPRPSIKTYARPPRPWRSFT